MSSNILLLLIVNGNENDENFRIIIINNYFIFVNNLLKSYFDLSTESYGRSAFILLTQTYL